MPLSNQTPPLEPHKGKPQTIIGGTFQYSALLHTLSHFDLSKFPLLLYRSQSVYFNTLKNTSRTGITRPRC